MQRQKPIYQSLLIYLAQDLLDQFISRLTTVESKRKLPVTYSTEVDQPVYRKKKYYHSAMCYAASVDNLPMADALLSIGANPNIPDLETLDGSALLIASRSKKPNAGQILRRLLAEPNIERYVINALGCSLFLRANGDTAFVLRLLESDPLVSILAEDEKKKMSDTIAAATKSESAFETNQAICQTLEAAYLSEKISLKNKLDKAIPNSTKGQPITKIVLSYLFRQEPHSLNVMKNWLLHNDRRPEAQEKTTCKVS